ncbi:MAG: DAK2 domain-containing protein [Candidatus Eremiobacteraeota bacterium]|nr:DAK2 domain-containing protein [Candidatus Eremiobacteraeota bacterium]
MVAVTTLDGRAFSKFVVAGTYFLRKYRGVLNDLNVFPVPDGDTGSNLYLTVKAALVEAARVRERPLNVVAAAAAHGALLGARGNSGVIFSQMLRGFAHSVRHRESIDTFELAVGLKDAVAAARAALLKPVEGTILSVATAAAEEAYHLATHEHEFYRLNAAVVRAANEALDRTPEQLPILKEAGVVDSGGAGFVYFLEGILRFLPEETQRATAYPRRPIRATVFTQKQIVGDNKFCTEFILEETRLEPHALRDLLERRGDSLLVVGGAPTLRVHIHTDDPELVKTIASEHGRLERIKVENMEEQHNVLVVEAPARAFSILAIVPGLGFDRIARELGAEETLVTPRTANPSVREILLGIQKCLAETVLVLPNDPNIILAAREAAKLARKRVVVAPTKDVPSGLAVLIATSGRCENGPLPDESELAGAAARVRTAVLFFAGKETVLGGVAVAKGAPVAQLGPDLYSLDDLGTLVLQTAERLAAGEAGLLTLYYGGSQKEHDAEALARAVRERLQSVEVEWYFGGQKSSEYVVSFER